MLKKLFCILCMFVCTFAYGWNSVDKAARDSGGLVIERVPPAAPGVGGGWILRKPHPAPPSNIPNRPSDEKNINTTKAAIGAVVIIGAWLIGKALKAAADSAKANAR